VKGSTLVLARVAAVLHRCDGMAVTDRGSIELLTSLYKAATRNAVQGYTGIYMFPSQAM
jgi:hypothetical protein